MPKAIYFTDLALQYFPESNKRSATRQLKRWILISCDLRECLQKLGYLPRQRALTPRQHEAIIQHLGEP